MRPRIRFRGPVEALGGYGLGLDMAPEKHYLQLDNVALDYGYAAGAATGIGSGGTWSWVLKVESRHTTSPRYYGEIYDNNASSPHMQIDAMYAENNASVSANGRTTAGASQYQFTGQLGTSATGPQVLAIVHRNIATRRADLYACRSGATLGTTGADLAAGGESRTPLHLSVGAQLRVITGVHTPVATTYSPLQLIATALIDGAATETELQQYSLARDARDVWSSSLWGYWPASGMYLDGATWKTRNLAGSVPITWSGPTRADLVRL